MKKYHTYNASKESLLCVVNPVKYLEKHFRLQTCNERKNKRCFIYKCKHYFLKILAKINYENMEYIQKVSRKSKKCINRR